MVSFMVVSKCVRRRLCKGDGVKSDLRQRCRVLVPRFMLVCLLVVACLALSADEGKMIIKGIEMEEEDSDNPRVRVSISTGDGRIEERILDEKELQKMFERGQVDLQATKGYLEAQAEERRKEVMKEGREQDARRQEKVAKLLAGTQNESSHRFRSKIRRTKPGNEKGSSSEAGTSTGGVVSGGGNATILGSMYLTLKCSPFSVKVGQEMLIELELLNPRGQPFEELGVWVRYDRRCFQPLDMLPDQKEKYKGVNLLPNSKVKVTPAANEVKVEKGEIWYHLTAGDQGAVDVTGPIATLRFKALARAVGSRPFKFLFNRPGKVPGTFARYRGVDVLGSSGSYRDGTIAADIRIQP